MGVPLFCHGNRTPDIPSFRTITEIFLCYFNMFGCLGNESQTFELNGHVVSVASVWGRVTWFLCCHFKYKKLHRARITNYDKMDCFSKKNL